MKKILAVLIAALMICLTIVPAQAAVSSVSLAGSALALVKMAIETFGETGSRIHEAYADTIQKAMDYRRYYNEAGLSKAYDKMAVSMNNRGSTANRTFVDTSNNSVYNVIDKKITYNNQIYYNKTYNSYYTQITNNDIDYNYFITYAPTYTNITYIVDGCNDPSQAVSINYYFQLPDGRNSYYLTADDVFGVLLGGSGRVINYDVVPENDNCVGLFHFDGNLVDAAGGNLSIEFVDGVPDSYVSQSAFGKYLYLKGGGEARKFRVNFDGTAPLTSDFTVEFRLHMGAPTPFYFGKSDMIKTGTPHDNDAFEYFNPNLVYNGNPCKFYIWYPSAVFCVEKSLLNMGSDFSLVRYSTGEISGYNLWYNYTGVADISMQGHDAQSYTASAKLEAYAQDKENALAAVKAQSPSAYAARSLSGSFSGNWYSVAFVYDAKSKVFVSYLNGVRQGFIDASAFSGSLSSLTFDIPVDYFAYCMIDELRISKGALYTESYTPASAPFDVSYALVVPTLSGGKDIGTIAIQSFIPVNDTRIGGVRPSYPAQGDVYISLDADKKVTSCQQYQSGSWVEVDGCFLDRWLDIIPLVGGDLSQFVVSVDDYTDFVDKKEDPVVGVDANPDAEAASLTVHYYEESTTNRVRRDTVYQNLAVGASFTITAPSLDGYEPLASSAKITVKQDGEYIFYYSAVSTDKPGGGGEGDNDPSKPGFFDGLLSSVKSLVNVICGFVGGVVQSLLSGLTGIISTLIDAFKAVLSLGGHFGDFLAAALGFVPREIIDLLIAGIAVTIALAIIRFIRG